MDGEGIRTTWPRRARSKPRPGDSLDCGWHGTRRPLCSAPIVTRDRSGAYAQGIALGAPDAQQVGDRYHLLQHWATAVEEWLAPWRPPGVAASDPDLAPDGAAVAPAEAAPASRGATASPFPRETPVSPAVVRRCVRWEQIHALRAEGAPVSVIAYTLGGDRATGRA